MPDRCNACQLGEHESCTCPPPRSTRAALLLLFGLLLAFWALVAWAVGLVL